MLTPAPDFRGSFNVGREPLAITPTRGDQLRVCLWVDLRGRGIAEHNQR
jgi:hypothetical protein